MTAKGGRSRQPATPAPQEDDPAGAWDDDGILRIGEDPEKPELEVMFRLGGKEYEVNINPPANLLIKYLDRVRKWGPNAALSWLLEEELSAEGYEALLNDPRVSKKDFGEISGAAVRIAMGNSPAPKSRTSR